MVYAAADTIKSYMYHSDGIKYDATAHRKHRSGCSKFWNRTPDVSLSTWTSCIHKLE